MTTDRPGTTVVFTRPFRLSGLDELLPAGEYRLESEIAAPAGFLDAADWKSSVLIHLQATSDAPGLARTLTVPLSELERATAEDRLTGRPLAELLLDRMLADPMVRLVMRSDGISDAEMRRLYAETDGGAGSGDAPVDLDGRRSPAGQIAADIRRHALQGVEHDRDLVRRRQEELEAQLLAGPAETWVEAAAEAAYLIRLYALTADAQDARRRWLIDRALADLARLAEREAGR